MNKTRFLVTHDGLPHTDDFSCVALLSILFERKGYDNVELIRTRDEKILSSYKNNPDAIIFDIGGGELDHHYDKNFDGGRMYSSIGKVWAKYKEDIKSTFGIDEISWSEIDKNVVAPIDLTDNTGNMNPLNYVFNSIRSVGISEYGNINDDSMDYCGEFIVEVWENILEAESKKTKDRVEFENLPVIELEGKKFKFNKDASRFIPAGKCKDGIIAYIFATTKGTFSVREVVPGTIKKGMMKDESLGVIFTHKTGFIGEVKSLECIKNILA
jgi:uncharacterized UPF0160 family protein